MTPPADISSRRPRGRIWLRHGWAGALTAIINVAVVMFLAVWARPARPQAPLQLRAVPVDVVDLTAEEMDLSQAESPADQARVEPPPRPALPAPPVPRMPAPAPALEAPPPLSAGSIRIAAGPVDVPAYVPEAAVPAPVRPGPVAPGPVRPSPLPERPRRLGAARQPVLIQPPDLADYYPRRARMKGVTGRTTVRLTIAPDGRVTDVRVLASTPPGVFEVAARRVGRVLRFRPAVRDDRPVPAAVSLNLIWRLED